MRKKLPSDPYEFEILLYAERLAREEGILGFEESSDGESEPETTYSSKRKKLKTNEPEIVQESSGSINNVHSKNPALQNKNNFIQSEHQPKQHQQVQQPDEGNFKWVYGVNLFNTWFSNRIEQFKPKSPIYGVHQKIPDDLLKVKTTTI